MTELIEAIFSYDLRKLKDCLPNGLSVNYRIPGTEGCTPLHIVAGIENEDGKGEMLVYLLEAGADPNARSFDDLTPVHLAAMWNNCWELEKLLESGGNPWLTDNENKNSFDLAIDNHAYEAYQLLHRYLSEDKLNFRNWVPAIHSTPKCWEKSDNDNNGTSNYESEYAGFCTANENFPLYFSSTDEEPSDHYLSLSRMLKKNISTKPQSPRKNQSKNMKNDSLHKTSITKADVVLSFDSDTTGYSFEIKVTKRRACKTPTISSYESSEIDSTSEDEFIVPESDSTETVVDCDNQSGITLVEKCSVPSDSFVYRKCNISRSHPNSNTDWKSFDSQNSVSSTTFCPSHSNSHIMVPDEYKLFSNTKIFLELQKLGDDPGPVSDSTREVYLRRLTRLKMGCEITCPLPAPKYCSELYRFLEGKSDSDRTQNLINGMNEEFNELDPDFKWRGGNQRCCFNYFLLDPRVTQNLPTRLKELSFEKTFLLFVDALFYVGKGTKGRPYNHLIEAAKAATDTKLKSVKISHILDIWDAGLGVISLHCFNNCIPIEAYTQEACIIEAVGLENLTNIKAGNYYGKATKWKKSWKRQVGVALLHRALQIFILEGEKQIMPKDVRVK